MTKSLFSHRMLTKLLLSAALLIGLGTLTPTFAEPSLRASEVAQRLLDGDNPGRYLALGRTLKQNASIALADRGTNSALSTGQHNVGDLRLHGYREPSTAAVVSAPEPASMLLLGSGLVGAAALFRKLRRP